MDSKIMIDCRNLSIGYDKAIYSGINLSLKSGTLTSLLGVNGSGKSTLIKTLCGFIPPVAGSITIQDTPLEKLSSRKKAETIGVVLTDREMNGGLTVYEVVALGRYPYTDFFGQLKSDDRQMIEWALEETGIADKKGRYMAELSDGERQKVMISKALAQDCPVIILDEPTAFLDITARIKTMKLLGRIAHQNNKTIFLSTHDLDTALRMSDNLWLMLPNQGVFGGSVSEAVTHGWVDSLLGDEASELSYILDRQY